MKRQIISVFCMLFLLVSVTACGKSDSTTADKMKMLQPQTTENNISGKNYRTVCENDSLCLNFNQDTTDIQCVVKSSGYIWSTDAKCREDKTVYAPFSISYSDSKGTGGVMNAYTDSVASGQYAYEQTDKGIKIKYTLGVMYKNYLYPTALSPDRYEYLYNKCDDKQKETLDIAYEKLYLEDYDTDIQKKMEEKYPNIQDGCIVTLRNEGMQDNLKAELTDVFNAIGYDTEDKKDDTVVKNDTTNDNPIFNVTMYYELDGDNLVVRIPQTEIEMSSGCHIKNMDVLECFKGAETNDGYFVLPDGSGSVMNYRNGKVNISDYRVPLYQLEDTINYSSKVLDPQNAILNIYGCREADNGYLAVIEDSEAHSFVNARSGSDTVTSRVWPSFTIWTADSMTLASTVQVEDDMAMAVYQSKRYQGEIRLRFKFFSGGDANYSKMAQWYRNYLLGDREDIGKLEMPLNLEMVCELKNKKSLLGFQYQSSEVLTDYEEIQSITDELLDSGIKRLNVKISGWCNGGYENGNLTRRIQLEKAVGSQSELKSLISSLNGKSVGVYLDADVQYAYADTLSFGLISNKAAAHLLSDAKAQISNYDFAVYQADKKNGKRYVLSPSAVVSSIQTLSKKASELSSGISLRNIGKNLNADYNKKNLIDRQDAEKLLVNELKEIQKNKIPLMTSVGNYYTLPYIDQLLNTPVCSDQYDVCDYSIPFLAMVISGKMEYSSAAINLSNSEPKDILRLIENGAAPYYVLTGKLCSNALAVKCDRLYSSYYTAQKESIQKIYKQISAGSVFYGHQLIGHERLQDGVFRSTFDNGWVIVNYNNYAVQLDGQTVDAYGFVTGQGANK